MNTKQTAKLPSLSDLYTLCRSVKGQICDDYRCSDDPDDTTPGIQLTIGWSEDGSWNYQTGDNSYSGGAYGHRNWAVVSVYRSSNCRELAREIQDELAGCLSY